jgi:hypothetical protein
MLFFPIRRVSLALLAAAGMSLPALAQPQGGYGAQTPPPDEVMKTEVSARELDQFAAAARQVQGIHQAAQQEIQAAKSPEDQAAIQQQAQQEMVTVIEAQGLTIPRYEQIVVAMRTDEAVAERIMKRLRDE